MPDRLDELKRQRALVAEHLQWIDQEILRATGASRPAATPPPLVPAPIPPATPVPVVAPPSSATNLPGPTAPPAPPPDQPAPDRQNIHRDMKRGCLLWAAIGLVLVLVAFVLMSWLGRLHRQSPKTGAGEGSAPERHASAGVVPGSPDRLG